MDLSSDSILDSLEIAPLLLPWLEGRVEPLGAPYVEGRVTWDSDPFANLVGAARLGDGEADSTIWDIVAFFADQGKSFGWLVGPRSTPPDLTERLERVGLSKIGAYAGMVYEDIGRPLPHNEWVHIWEATHEDFETVASVLSQGMGVAREQTQAVTEALFFGDESIWRRMYLASLDDAEEPVAFASMVYVPHKPLVHLFSAATLEGYRGRGLYSALVARRIQDAQRDGAVAALIHANQETSAPICRKLGFVDWASFDLLAWYPRY